MLQQGCRETEISYSELEKINNQHEKVYTHHYENVWPSFMWPPPPKKKLSPLWNYLKEVSSNRMYLNMVQQWTVVEVFSSSGEDMSRQGWHNNKALLAMLLGCPCALPHDPLNWNVRGWTVILNPLLPNSHGIPKAKVHVCFLESLYICQKMNFNTSFNFNWMH